MMDHGISGFSSENFSLHSEGGRPKLERRCLTESKHGRRGGQLPPKQEEYPPLPRSGYRSLGNCQHCSTFLIVKTNLPPPRKSTQKFRCAACMRISIFSVPQHSTDQELRGTQEDLVDYRSFSHQDNQQQVDEQNSNGSKLDSLLGEMSEGMGEDSCCLSDVNSSSSPPRSSTPPWSSPWSSSPPLSSTLTSPAWSLSSTLTSPAWSSSSTLTSPACSPPTITWPESRERSCLTRSKNYFQKLLGSGRSKVDEGEWSSCQEPITEVPDGRRRGRLPPKQEEYPSLPRPDDRPLVICQHCFKLLVVPTNLPLRGKSTQKLRCGACMRILIFSVPRHTTDQESKIPEQTRSRRTEAEGSCTKRTKEKRSHREGETNDTSRAHPGNQTTSEEIEHMTSSIKQKEITRDGIGQTDSGEPLLSDLNWRTATAPDSGDQPQSPRYMTSLEAEETIPEQPPSSIRGTEAGSTPILQTKGNGSQCEEQGDTTEAVRDGKSRAQSTNLTTSGEIKDMTPPTKREDLTMDSFGKSDEVSNAQAESMPVNLIDWNSTQCTQRELIVGSNKSLRPDVLALGFKSLQDDFNPERILCLFSVSEGVVEMLFSHAEGMAMLFGVGLSFSSVVLTKDGVKDGTVEVKGLQQLVWMNRWSISEMSNFSPLLFNSSTSSIQPSGIDPEPRSTVLSFSPEQAAEWFGVGLEGSPSYFIMMPLSEFQHEVSNVTAVSPSWIASLYDFLSCKGHAGNDVEPKGMGSEHNHGRSLTTKGLSLPSSSSSALGTSLYENNHRSQGQELPEVTAIGRGMQSQPRQLTVIIRVDPENSIFRDTESKIPLVNPSDVDPALRKFLMVPEVTIKFLYDPRLRGRGSKKMTSTLDVNFLIKGTVSGDPEKFGWYHDQLRLSFKCKQRGEVTRVSRENEIVSDHEIRTADSGYTRANSTIALIGKGREQKWSLGYTPIGGAQFIGSSRQENTVGSGENHELSARISAVCLKKGNFSIQKLEGLSELAYRATFFPSLHLYNVWDLVDRDHLQSSGIMSAVPVKIEGDWEVMRDDDDGIQGNSESAQVKGTSFCKYEFSCKRELNLLRSQISQRGRVHLSNSPNAEPELSVETVQRLIEKHLQQKLVCGFIINHSFSHMPRLERPDPYVWNMVGGPCPRPADEIVGAESQE